MCETECIVWQILKVARRPTAHVKNRHNISAVCFQGFFFVSFFNLRKDRERKKLTALSYFSYK